jgi:hypothetical protein
MHMPLAPSWQTTTDLTAAALLAETTGMTAAALQHDFTLPQEPLTPQRAQQVVHIQHSPVFTPPPPQQNKKKPNGARGPADDGRPLGRPPDTG